MSVPNIKIKKVPNIKINIRKVDHNLIPQENISCKSVIYMICDVDCGRLKAL